MTARVEKPIYHPIKFLYIKVKINQLYIWLKSISYFLEVQYLKSCSYYWTLIKWVLLHIQQTGSSQISHGDRCLWEYMRGMEGVQIW